MGMGVRGGGGGASGSGGGGGERWRWILFFAMVSVFFLLSLLLLLFSSSPPRLRLPGPAAAAPSLADDLRCGHGAPPCLAYLLVGARGDGARLLRLLLAVYHPRNRYVLHLSADASDSERRDLAAWVAAATPAVGAFRNVAVVGAPTAGTPVGSSGLAGTLRAAAVLLRLHPDWDWFITLNAADYPVVTQDDLIYVLSNVSRQFNFVDHTSDIGQKESEKVQSMIFIEYCILGWENLPRILLMYFNNIMLPQEGYFHSVICNSLEFRNFTVNNDLRYKAWDNPPQTEPVFLDMTHYDKMVDSGAPFARRFRENESLLDKIDGNVLGRWGHGPVPGAWCSGRKSWFSDPCSQWSDVNIVRPGPQGIKLRQYINRALEEGEFGSKSCRR
uniref:Uncharacterized protein n=1 Tax=Oryza nivara TaxID=4536 RepID=A0A0E0H9Q9_ORYNI